VERKRRGGEKEEEGRLQERRGEGRRGTDWRKIFAKHIY
jgi:hypothetical protein